LNSPPTPFCFIPTPHSWNVSTSIFFSIYIHMYTVFAPLHPPTPFPHLFPSPIVINTLRQDFFCLTVTQFMQKREKSNDNFSCLR
jgi:hypothetical protein